MQDVFRRDGFLANAAFGKGDVFRDARRQVVADHQHIQMFGDGVDRVGAGGVGGGGQHVGQAGDLDNVGRVAAASAFGVESVDGAALEGFDRGFNEAGFVQRVGVDGDLHVELVGDAQAIVECGGGGAPNFVQFQGAGTRQDHFF